MAAIVEVKKCICSAGKKVLLGLDADLGNPHSK
jgi:hypothetical protein